MSEFTLRFVVDDGDLVPKIIKCKAPDKSEVTRVIVLENKTGREPQAGDEFAFCVVNATGPKRRMLIKIRLTEYLPPLTSDLVLDGFWLPDLQRKVLEICLKNKAHLLLRGHKGTGKTTLVELVARELNLDYTKVDCGTWVEPMDVVGSNSSDGEGGTFFAPSGLTQFCERVAEKHGDTDEIKAILHLDEVSRAPSVAADNLHPLLDKTRQVTVTVTGLGDYTVNMPKCVMVMATANFSGGIYVGSGRLDGALSDRMEQMVLEFMPAKQEEELICRAHPSVTAQQARSIVAVASKLREALDDTQSGITRAPSVRRTMSAGMYVAGGLAVKTAIEAAFLGEYQDALGNEQELVKEKIRGLVSDLTVIT